MNTSLFSTSTFMNNEVGIGFRRDLALDLIQLEQRLPAFIELAPENWMGIGGHWGRILRQAADKYAITCHGLSLSIGSPDPLDWEFVKGVKRFLDEFDVAIYSEHLSYSKCNNAHLYDLLPIPFREDAVRHIVQRIKEVQDFLGRRLMIENVSYYTPVAAEMKEEEFIRAIVEESGCGLLLDVNNVYVNAFNHSYDAKDFIASLPLEAVGYMHMAGHEQVAPDLIIDTHGQPIIDPVFELFEWTIRQLHPVPVLLERDFNIPEVEALQDEMGRLSQLIAKHWSSKYVA
jgi:uncharacterized protein (UPF0276 family)